MADFRMGRRVRTNALSVFWPVNLLFSARKQRVNRNVCIRVGRFSRTLKKTRNEDRRGHRKGRGRTRGGGGGLLFHERCSSPFLKGGKNTHAHTSTQTQTQPQTQTRIRTNTKIQVKMRRHKDKSKQITEERTQVFFPPSNFPFLFKNMPNKNKTTKNTVTVTSSQKCPEGTQSEKADTCIIESLFPEISALRHLGIPN